MTEEQLARAQFVQDSQRMIDSEWTQAQYRDLPQLPPDHFWLHGTDLPFDGGYEMYEKALIDEKLIVFVSEIQYQKRGDWMDNFPPFCYILTQKGKSLLANPRPYVMQEEYK